jgi:hypothetical protein
MLKIIHVYKMRQVLFACAECHVPSAGYGLIIWNLEHGTWNLEHGTFQSLNYWSKNYFFPGKNGTASSISARIAVRI